MLEVRARYGGKMRSIWIVGLIAGSVGEVWLITERRSRRMADMQATPQTAREGALQSAQIAATTRDEPPIPLDSLSLTVIYDNNGYRDDLWFDETEHGDAPWQIIYHGLHFTNLYLAPSESSWIPWPGEEEKLHRLMGGRDSGREKSSSTKTYSKVELTDFLNHIRTHMDTYLEGFQPEEPCWPSWYDENQLEFHINNLRHLQQHIGAVVDRHDRFHNLDIGWQ